MSLDCLFNQLIKHCSAAQKMYTRVQRFYQLVSPRPLMVAKFNSNTFIKKVFESFRLRLTSKFAKKKYGFQKTLNLILIWNPLKKFKKKHAKKYKQKSQKNGVFVLLFLCIKVFSL
jgi:hypothetical protein